MTEQPCEIIERHIPNAFLIRTKSKHIGNDDNDKPPCRKPVGETSNRALRDTTTTTIMIIIMSSAVLGDVDLCEVS